MLKQNKVKIPPLEFYNELAVCMAYCIGATKDNVSEIANKITIHEIEECANQIRNMMLNK